MAWREGILALGRTSEREAPTPRAAAAIGRTPGLGIDPGWNAQRVDVMRWVLRMKREANRVAIDAVLAATGDRPIVEVSTRDPWWGARPVADRYEGRNVLGRLWMELRQQLREGRSGGALRRLDRAHPRWLPRRPRRRSAHRPRSRLSAASPPAPSHRPERAPRHRAQSLALGGGAAGRP